MLSIILPTYNEAENISLIVTKITRLLEDKNIKGEIIIVDDNSPDGTADLAQKMSGEFPVRVCIRKNKRGLARSVVEGFKLAKGDIFLVMDADLSHPVEKIPDMIGPILKGKCDMTVGSRYVSEGNFETWTFIRKAMSKWAGLLAKGVTNISDPTSGYMAIKKEILNGVNLDPIGWKIVLETIVKTNSRVIEVPIVFVDRQKGKSKLNFKIQMAYLYHLWKLYCYKYV